jgi:hypothetical protein
MLILLEERDGVLHARAFARRGRRLEPIGSAAGSPLFVEVAIRLIALRNLEFSAAFDLLVDVIAGSRPRGPA